MLETQRNKYNISSLSATHLHELTVHDFRCFAHKVLKLDTERTLIIGANGAGKSSLLEAIYYICYAQSFKTRLNLQMIRTEAPGFHLQLKLEQGDGQTTTVSAGVSAQKKVLKINGQTVTSHGQIAKIFNCITLAQEDMALVNGSPDKRRSFLNQNQYLSESSWLELTKRYRQVLEQRNALLLQPHADSNQMLIWTEQLWQLSQKIQAWRIQFLDTLNTVLAELLQGFFPQQQIQAKLAYKPAVDCQQNDFATFYGKIKNLLGREKMFGRTLFGCHLDDFGIEFFNRCAKAYASRGEQKILTILLKCATVKVLQQAGKTVNCVLVDDFLTDLDEIRVARCLEIIDSLKLQTIITLPLLRKDLFPPCSKQQEIFI